MSKISERNIDKIKNEILYLLYESKLKGIYTKKIADEVARDDEFVLRLLKDLEREKIVKTVNLNKIKFVRRKKWLMTEEAYKKYKELNV